MARSAAAKKVAKAASAGAASKGFKVNRSLIFPGAMVLVLLLGAVLVLFARDRRSDEAFDSNQHWYSTYDFYECDGYLDQTYLASGSETDLPIEAQGDGLIHVQPFHGSVTDLTGTVGAFMATVGVQFTDESIELPDERVLTEGGTECEPPEGNGDTGAELRVLRWNSVDSPSPVSFVDDLSRVRLNDNGQVVAFALVHPDVDSADIPLPDTTSLRLQLGLNLLGPEPVDSDTGGDDDGNSDNSGDEQDDGDDG